MLAVAQSSGINSTIREGFCTKVCSWGVILIPQTIGRVDGETDNWVNTQVKVISTAVWVLPPCTGWFFYAGGWNVLCSISKGATQARRKSVSKYLEPHILGMQVRGIPTWSVFRQRSNYGMERKGVQKLQLEPGTEHGSSGRWKVWFCIYTAS